MNEDSEYKSKLIVIVNAITFWKNTLKKRASDFNWGKQSKIIKHFI